jgi:hypothetical protein
LDWLNNDFLELNLTNVSPISRRCRVIAEAEYDAHEVCKVYFVETGNNVLELTIRCEETREPSGAMKTRRKKSPSWWMSGTSTVIMTISYHVPSGAKDRGLTIIQYLDGIEVSRALFYLTHRRKTGSSSHK